MTTFNIGQANANNQIIGDQARLTIGSQPTVVSDLVALEAAVRANLDAVPDGPAVEHALSLLREQLSAQPPDPAGVQPLLGVITTAAGHVPSVVAAAASLERNLRT